MSTVRVTIGCVASYDEDRVFMEKPPEAIHALQANLIYLAHSRNPKIIEDYFSMIDGILIGGGLEDISSTWQNEPPHPNLGYVDETRDYFEITLLREAFKRNMPVLGICRGPQIINIAAGGTIYQDLPSQRENTVVDHLGDWDGYDKGECEPNTHIVRVAPDSIIGTLTAQENFIVNSYHHQAVKDLASNFTASAWASDGVIEAIESKEHNFVVGVQWHVELLWNQPGHYNIFEKFITEVIKFASSSSYSRFIRRNSETSRI